MPSVQQTGSAADLTRPFLPAQEALLQRRMTKVQFWIQFHVEFGQSICLVGSSSELGKWILSDGVPLAWSEGDMWNVVVEIPAGSVVEYKYVVVGPGGHAAAWQQGNNSVLALRHVDEAIEVFDNWYNSPGSQVVPANSPPVTRENRLLSWATEIEAQVSTQRQELRRVRMELVAAQEEARIAREEARQLKTALAQAEAQRISAVKNLKHAEMVNQVLQAQLSETMTSFRQAVEVAVKLMESSAPQRQSKASRKGDEGLDTEPASNPGPAPQDGRVLSSVPMGEATSRGVSRKSSLNSE